MDMVASEACSISSVLAPGAGALPAAFLVDNVDTARYTENRLQPWPPPRSACIQIRWDDHSKPFLPKQTLLPLRFEIVECIKDRMEIRCCFNSLTAELLVYCSPTEIEWDATRTVIVFAPGVHSAQLQPTVFKWSVPSGYDTHLLISSPGVDVLMDMLLIWRALYSLWTWCYIDTLHWFTGEVQEHYTCEKVLPVAVCKGLISQLIMQGSPHYFDLMQWSFNHTQLQSAFWFYTPGQIIFSRCALVQWKIPWTIRCVSLQFWFHCCHAEHKMYNPKTFQWSLSCCYLSAFIGGSAVPILLWLQFAIRDSLGPQEFFSSIKIGKLLDLLEMVELKPWPSWELLSSVAAVI
jgi:hypothetical protein